MLEFNDSAISVCNLTKKFGEDVVLNNLSFDIPKNKIITILGFSGAGKSTLLKTMLGLLTPTSGDIYILGNSICNISKMELIERRRNMGMLFQYAALFDSMTAFDNVAFPLKEFTDLSEEKIKTKVNALLDSVGLVKSSNYKYPSELSGGMRKRVGLARALALSPQIMFYDEPTTGLDPITTKLVGELIVSTSKNNSFREMASVIISHNIKLSLEISDFIAFLYRGNIVEYKPVNEFVKSENSHVKEFIGEYI